MSSFLADQVYGNQDMHDLVRRQCIDYMVSSFCLVLDFQFTKCSHNV